MKHLPSFSQQAAAAIEALRQLEALPAGDIELIISPYRLCPLGAHVDHQGGPVLGRTIATGTVLAYAPLQEGRLRLHSQHFGSLDFPLEQPPDLGCWARYAQAAALALGRSHRLKYGFAGFVSGTLIGTGLGSSASVSLAYLLALAQVNGIALPPHEFVALEFQLENDILGLQIGLLDPATIVSGRADALLYIDTLKQTVLPIPDPLEARDWAWLVAFSGLSRQLAQSGFNQRVAECRQAAERLQAGASRLSDISPEVFAGCQDVLPEPLRRRAAHYFSEVGRVQRGAQVWARGDADEFGALMNASCESSIHQYESGHPALVDLHRLLRQAPGVYGGRFSGGGYGGCVIGLVREEAFEEAKEYMSREYARQHPELAARAEVYRVP
ncbi:MAG TPA: galactokinase family protein, partial [Anaerolineales bacterium]|nr:galactokinase family protein [Anaerolineales bacterium]